MRFLNKFGVALPLPSRSTHELFAMEVTISHAADSIDYELRDIREWDGIRRIPLHVCEKSARWFPDQCFGNPRRHNMIKEPLPQVSRNRSIATAVPLP